MCLHVYISGARQEMFVLVFSSIHLGKLPTWVQEQILWGWGVEQGICQAYPQLRLRCLSQMVMKL